MVFYNIYGEEVSVESLRDKVIEYYQENDGTLTDFEVGSLIYNVITALSVLTYDIEDNENDILSQTNIDTADGEYLDTLAEQPYINLTRDEGNEANGTVIFTLNEALTDDYIIPEGTQLISGDLIFETLNECIISAGDLSEETTVEAEDSGIEYNIEANTISLVDNNVPYTVNNPYKFSDGTDYEEDEEFRQRIIASLSNTHYGSADEIITRLIEEFGDIAHDIQFRTCECDYTGIFVPNTYITGKQSELTQSVQAYLNDQNNIILGQSFVVNSPVSESISIHLSGAEVGDYDVNTLQSADVALVKSILEKYVIGGSISTDGGPIEFTGLNVGESFNCEYICSIISETIGYPVYISNAGGEEYIYKIGLSSGKDKFDLTVKVAT